MLQLAEISWGHIPRLEINNTTFTWIQFDTDKLHIVPAEEQFNLFPKYKTIQPEYILTTSHTRLLKCRYYVTKLGCQRYAEAQALKQERNIVYLHKRNIYSIVSSSLFNYKNKVDGMVSQVYEETVKV